MPGKPTLRDRISRRNDYAEAMSGPLSDILVQLERQTHLKTLAPQMMSGRLQGRMLAMLSKLQRPKRILEVGTFTGYATLCLAEGLTASGTLDTLEGDAEMANLAAAHIKCSPYADRITIHAGQALTLLSRLSAPYDLIFLDADKIGYPVYLPLLIDRLAPGGLLIADNVLWDGKTGGNQQGRVAQALHRYNRLVLDDGRLSVVVLPMRDGLSVARRER